MHFILTAIGSYGDVHPLVGLGQRLATRGHRVQVLTNPYFADVVETAGLELLPMMTADDYQRLIKHRQLWHPTKGVNYLFREAIVNRMRQMYALIEEHYGGDDTILVAHPLDVASRLFREREQAKVALATLAPQAMWSRHRPPKLPALPIGPAWPAWWNQAAFWLGNRLVIDRILKGPINRFRLDLGLPRVGRLFPNWWFRANLNLCLFPEWFAPIQPDWPRPVQAVGFPLWDSGECQPLAAELQEFLAAGEPPIVFTPGSANRYAVEYFEVSIRACQQLGCRGLLLSKFAEQIPKSLPEDIRHFCFVPFRRLLPHTKAVVHHGGIGTSSQVLAAGVPQLIRPLAFDQYDNALRLCELRVAEQIVPKRFTTKRVAAALERLNSSPSVAQACRDAVERCEQDALGRACDLLEGL